MKIKDSVMLPSEWKNGVIVEIPKKREVIVAIGGDDFVTDSLERLLLNRMERVVDGTLREEQARMDVDAMTRFLSLGT